MFAASVSMPSDAGEHSHQHEIAGDRNEAVRELELAQSLIDVPAAMPTGDRCHVHRSCQQKLCSTVASTATTVAQR